MVWEVMTWVEGAMVVEVEEVVGIRVEEEVMGGSEVVDVVLGDWVTDDVTTGTEDVEVGVARRRDNTIFK